MSWVAVPLAGLTVVATLIGGSFALRLHRELKTAIALSGGIVVAVALLDLIPEAFAAIGDERRVMTLVAAGFLLFFIAERFLVLHTATSRSGPGPTSKLVRSARGHSPSTHSPTGSASDSRSG